MHLSSGLVLSVTLLNMFNLVLGAPVETRGIVGSGCFGGTGTGCVVKHHSRADGNVLGRDPEAAPEPVTEAAFRETRGIVGSGCFGGTGTGCIVKQHKRADGNLVVRDPEAAPEPQGFTIGTPCFGSKKTGCTLKQGHKREEDSDLE
ncbi:uncharacterized protein RAG0_15114 [Rhynchosporium agropyri]|uniref:Secreted protein n=1 Tax=Rhynchosporium agropyri TaxID=914238 RepID=A0A1E1LJN9_9HELO|nr:uncharacterized protein RAG0_15114 [Rhynchosporium agropyri]